MLSSTATLAREYRIPAVVGATVIQQKSGHFLECPAFDRATVISIEFGVFELAFERLRIISSAANRVPVVIFGLLVVHDDMPPAALAGWVFLQRSALDHGGSLP